MICASAIRAGAILEAMFSAFFDRTTHSLVRGCEVDPHLCLHIVLRTVSAVFVHDTERKLRVGLALLGGLAEPIQRFGVVLRHA